MFLQTPIGQIEFYVVLGAGERIAGSEFTFIVVPIHPVLPAGMTVIQVKGILIKLSPRVTHRYVRVGFKWLKPWSILGSPESGEGLEAQSWEARGSLVVVGTEDYEALASRLPELALTEEDRCLVTYHPDGMEVVLPSVPADFVTSLHFVVAVNSFPEPVECSAWYAVDVPHNQLLAAASES